MSQQIKTVTRKDANKKEKIIKDEKQQTTKDEEPVVNANKPVKVKFGPTISFPYQRVWSRSVLILGVLFIVWYNGKQGQEQSFAKQSEEIITRTRYFPCTKQYKTNSYTYHECIPTNCGRIIADKVIEPRYIMYLLELVGKCLEIGDAHLSSVLDLHSGILTQDITPPSIYNLTELNQQEIFFPGHFYIVGMVRLQIQHEIAAQFGIASDKIYLTKPALLSRITPHSFKAIQNEYWHLDVHKEMDETMHYTSVLYLNDYNENFGGGRFIFKDKNIARHTNTIVEPKAGRLLMFTTDKNNLHTIEEVKWGSRLALTFSFTCDTHTAVPDPNPFKEFQNLYTKKK